MINLESRYFEWLYEMIKPPRKGYSKLCWQLWLKNFKAFVPNDQNRCEDGINLRYTFVELHIFNNRERTRVVQKFIQQECSVLEVMIALAQRMDFQMYDLNDTQDHTSTWFMELVTNLGLSRYSDDFLGPGRIKPTAEADIDRILDVLNSRTYDAMGHGSFFPLQNKPAKSRGTVEIWYQMMDYLDEKAL